MTYESGDTITIRRGEENWSVEPSGVIYFHEDLDGLLVAKCPGTARAIVSYKGKESSFMVTVESKNLTSIEVSTDPNPLTNNANTYFELKALAKFEGGEEADYSYSILWEPQTNNIETYDDTMIPRFYAIGAGNAIINFHVDIGPYFESTYEFTIYP